MKIPIARRSIVLAAFSALMLVACSRDQSWLDGRYIPVDPMFTNLIRLRIDSGTIVTYAENDYASQFGKREYTERDGLGFLKIAEVSFDVVACDDSVCTVLLKEGDEFLAGALRPVNISENHRLRIVRLADAGGAIRITQDLSDAPETNEMNAWKGFLALTGSGTMVYAKSASAK
jgi:hypothetical protein